MKKETFETPVRSCQGTCERNNNAASKARELTVTDLWNIQRMRRSRIQRRYIL